MTLQSKLQMSGFKVTAEIGMQSPHAHEASERDSQHDVPTRHKPQQDREEDNRLLVHLEEDEEVCAKQDASAQQEASAALHVRRAVMRQATVLCHKRCRSSGNNTCVESWQLRRPRSTMPRVICTAVYGLAEGGRGFKLLTSYSPFSSLAQQLKSATQEDLEERISTFKTLQCFLLRRATEEDLRDAGALELKISTNCFLLSNFFRDGAHATEAGLVCAVRRV
jgi:hypothetical protein